MKRIISILLCFTMLIVYTPAQLTFADSEQGTAIEVSSTEVYPGDSCCMRIYIRNAENLAALKYNLLYDDSVMTVSSVDKQYFVNGTNCDVNKNTPGIVKQSIVALDGLSGEGYLMNVWFNVKSDAAPGDYQLRLAVDEAFDTSFNNISIVKSPGTITVKERPHSQEIKNVSFYSNVNSDGEISQGSTIHYVVGVQYPQGLAAGNFNFEYDADFLQLNEVKLCDAMKSSTAIHSINTNNPGIIKVTYSDIDPITENSWTELIDVAFDIKKDISGSTTIKFTPSNLFDNEINDMNSQPISRTITIVRKSSELKTVWDGIEQDDRTFTVQAVLTSGSDVAAGDFWINYDVSKLECLAVETHGDVAESGAMVVSNPKFADGRINFSYVNSGGIKENCNLLNITFKPRHGVIGETVLTSGGKDIADTKLQNTTVRYPENSFIMPYGIGGEEAAGHDWATEYTVDAEPDCVNSGSKSLHCENCDETKDSQVIPALGHDLIHHERVVENCVNSGVREYFECKRCGDLFLDEECTVKIVVIPVVDALGHDWEPERTVDQEPTCTSYGSYSYHCTRCSEKNDIAVIDMLPHTLIHHERVNATCLDDGVGEYYECSVCRHLFLDASAMVKVPSIPVLSALGHDWETEARVDVIPTCTEPGSQSVHCTRCSETKDTKVLPSLGHDWNMTPTIDKPSTCTETGLQSIHCNRCRETKEQSVVPITGHSWHEEITPATVLTDGVSEVICSECGAQSTKSVINKLNVIRLTKTSYTYNGLICKPAVEVLDCEGVKIDPDYYDVTYNVDEPKLVGKYTVIIMLNGRYAGTKLMTYKINPKGTSISKLTAASKGFTAKWKAQKTQTTGYQIRYSLKSSMAKSKTVTITKNKTLTKKVTKLKAKKKYYVQVRTYKTVKGVKYYSKWSTKKTVKTK